MLNVTNQAMATSGNYRNFYYKGGRKYAHTIDPKTGRPVQHSLLSATVLAPTCAEADAYATSFMVMGLDKARQVLERKKATEGILHLSECAGRTERLEERGTRRAQIDAEAMTIYAKLLRLPFFGALTATNWRPWQARSASTSRSMTRERG